MAWEGSEGARLGEMVSQQSAGLEGAPGLVWKCLQHLPGINPGQKCCQLLPPRQESLTYQWRELGCTCVILNSKITKTRQVANQVGSTDKQHENPYSNF